MSTGPTPRIAEDECGEVIIGAVEDQQVIEWDNLTKGRISVKWKVAQCMHFNALTKSKRKNLFDQELWSSKVITGIWSIFRQIGNACNAHLHMEMQVERISNINQ
eukprot:636837-Ditylum_brightwellii.AAC.1